MIGVKNIQYVKGTIIWSKQEKDQQHVKQWDIQAITVRIRDVYTVIETITKNH